jgi:hypothetical protein
MAIGAAYFTFRELGLYPSPRNATRDHVADIAGFVPANVVAFEDSDVRLAAVDAAALGEKGIEHLSMACTNQQLSFATHRIEPHAI